MVDGPGGAILGGGRACGGGGIGLRRPWCMIAAFTKGVCVLGQVDRFVELVRSAKQSGGLCGILMWIETLRALLMITTMS
jgi:hypothetical protein